MVIILCALEGKLGGIIFMFHLNTYTFMTLFPKLKKHFPFRRNSQQLDVWQQLEQNWDSFYWLTGEIPPSIAMIISDIEPLFRRYVNRFGRTPKLNLRNQVKIIRNFQIGIFH